MFGRFRNRRIFRRTVRRFLRSSDPQSLNRTNQPMAGAPNSQGGLLQDEPAGVTDLDQVEPVQAGQPSLAMHLPTDCPRCGAPVRSDEVEWIDAANVECAYCGGVIRAQ